MRLMVTTSRRTQKSRETTTATRTTVTHAGAEDISPPRDLCILGDGEQEALLIPGVRTAAPDQPTCSPVTPLAAAGSPPLHRSTDEFHESRHFTLRTSTEAKETDMTELPAGKTAVIYGGGGGSGGGMARAFAREGAKVVLAGRTLEKLDAVAKDITSVGGSAEVAVVDVLDEQAVEEHIQAVVAEAGSVDVSPAHWYGMPSACLVLGYRCR
jgi:hypothetical protein